MFIKNNDVVMCLIGQAGSGKDTLAEQFVKVKGFKHISTGDVIRGDMRAIGIPTDRRNMNFFSKEMRSKVGNAYPANIAAERVVGDTIISGPRNTAEVKYLKEKFGKNFLLVAIDVPIEVRHKRALIRGQIKDNVSFEEFKAQEEVELHSPTHNLKELLRIADHTVDNSKDILSAFLQLNNLILGKQKTLMVE